ncbi:MAG: LysR family transcriptional regulator [Xanthobacteraceae bacterium]
MEMHQVRYFLATVSELNFTKAAEKCNVTQPSLTRAIKQLEDELGGDLFRRERPQAQLTELGQRMYPLLKQCYESALGARSLASAMKRGEIGTLKLALSRTVNLELLTSDLSELNRLFGRLELKLLRGTAPEILGLLKSGAADLAIAADLGEDWDRLDRWPLFTEEFGLLVKAEHPLASGPAIDIEELRQERWLLRAYCEHFDEATLRIRNHHVGVDQGHELTSEPDLITLLEAGFGVAYVPRSLPHPHTLKHAPVNGLDLKRTVYLYGVAGRERTAAATAILKMLRGADWSLRIA